MPSGSRYEQAHVRNSPWRRPTFGTAHGDAPRAPRYREGGAHAVKSYACRFDLKGATSNRQRVRGKMISRAVYPGVRDEGLETKTAIAWFDFGSSLDLGRSVRLEYAGAYDKPHEDVKLRTFALAREELEPCPIRADACAFSPTAKTESTRPYRKQDCQKR